MKALVLISLAACVLLLLADGVDAAGRPVKGKPEGAPDYTAEPRPTDGAHLALTVRKLEKGFSPKRKFLIWALGSSYTNKLGNGSELIALIRKRFPEAPEIEYKKMVGNSCPWQFNWGWAHQYVIDEQPDLVLIYTIGKPEHLEGMIKDIRQRSTADIIVPSIHWRMRGMQRGFWGKSESAPDQDVPAIRAICKTYGVEFVENRNEWAQYLRDNNLKIEDLLADAVHQSDYGRTICNMNVARHIHRADKLAYDPDDRERRVEKSATLKPGQSLSHTFTGNRIDLVGKRAKGAGKVAVQIDGVPAEKVDAFTMTYIKPNQVTRTDGGRAPSRDRSPHAVFLGKAIVPQTWTITMLDDEGSYKLVGSVTGEDGRGKNTERFVSTSGQIVVDPLFWRNAGSKKRNTLKGESFTWTVTRATMPAVAFDGADGELFRVRLAQALPNITHTVKLTAEGGPVEIVAFEQYQPPLKAE